MSIFTATVFEEAGLAFSLQQGCLEQLITTLCPCLQKANLPSISRAVPRLSASQLLLPCSLGQKRLGIVRSKYIYVKIQISLKQFSQGIK